MIKELINIYITETKKYSQASLNDKLKMAIIMFLTYGSIYLLILITEYIIGLKL